VPSNAAAPNLLRGSSGAELPKYQLINPRNHRLVAFVLARPAPVDRSTASWANTNFRLRRRIKRGAYMRRIVAAEE
jgi:hypothetical protein